jgi:hypothetical protein
VRNFVVAEELRLARWGKIWSLLGSGVEVEVEAEGVEAIRLMAAELRASL